MLVRKLCLGVFCLLALVGCGGGGGEEGGVIGTGFIQGTVSETKALASTSIQIKASSGETFSATLTRSQRFGIDEADVQGAAPYLLRADFGNGQYLYSVAYENSLRNIHNIHSYSDVVVRSWFKSNSLDLDAEFNSDAPLSSLPTQGQFDELAERIFTIVESVLADYRVTGEQLITASYNADDAGIDRYLDKNPVVVNDGLITVLITEPVSNTQSSTRSSFSLDTPIAASDTSAPRIVQDVKVFASGPAEMVIIWSPASDNVGVSGYQVLRDDILIDTTPYPVYTDNNDLQPGASYSYQIVPFDGSGNVGEPSQPVTQTLRTDIDNEPPPMPISVSSIEASSVRVILQWNLPNVADVVAFDIYRGQGDETPGPYIRSSSDEVTDPSVTGGTKYCYIVRSVDASNNKSGFTDPPFCVTTSGNPISTENTVNTSTTAELIIPNHDPDNCNGLLDQAVITSNLTLGADETCYRVTTDITVGQDVDLILLAGTTLMFSQGVGLTVTEFATMAAKGTREEPVIFTGMRKRQGYWKGIEYNKTESEDNILKNSVIEYAGGAANPVGLLVISATNDRARLKVEGSLIRENKGFGFSFGGSDTYIDSFAGNTVTRNDKVGLISLALLNSIGEDNNFTENYSQHIVAGTMRLIDTDTTIPNLNVPIYINGINMEQANLTIEAGADIRFQEDKYLRILDGDLKIEGTADNKVRLGGTITRPGFWGGVHIVDSSASSLKNVIIEYGGAPVLQQNANLVVSRSNVFLDNVELRDSSARGYAIDDESEVSPPASAITLIGNALPQ